MRTDKAEDQLRDIIYYIADDSGSVDVALKYLDKIEESINCLKDNCSFQRFSNFHSLFFLLKLNYQRRLKNLL